LVIVIAIIAIIAAIAIPMLLRSRMSANEAAAVTNIRMISTGETCFKTAAFRDDDGNGEGDYGTLAELGDPDGSGTTPPFIDAALATGNRLGYTYIVRVIPGSATATPSYTCVALPAAAGLTGYRQFFVDDTGVIRFTGDGSAVGVSSPPLD